jgi:hypothetical protein
MNANTVQSRKKTLLSTVVFVVFFSLQYLLFKTNNLKQNALLFGLYFVYNFLLFIFVNSFSRYLTTICRVFALAFLSPYALSAFFGLIFYVSTMHSSDLSHINYYDLLMMIFFVPYFVCGCFLATIPAIIVCFLNRIKKTSLTE